MWHTGPEGSRHSGYGGLMGCAACDDYYDEQDDDEPGEVASEQVRVMVGPEVDLASMTHEQRVAFAAWWDGEHASGPADTLVVTTEPVSCDVLDIEP